MKNKKRMVVLALSLVLAAGFMTSCGNEKEKPEEPKTQEEDNSGETKVPEDETDTPDTNNTEPKEGEENEQESNQDENGAVEAAAMSYFADFPEHKNMINVPELFEKIDAGEEMLILDIRQPDAYGEGHLKGAVNIPYGPAIAEALEMIPDDITIYVNCYSGQTSSQTVALLNIAGKYAVNIQSGYNNGISTAEGYEGYIDTEVNELDQEDYPVDAEIKAAIADYYDKAAADTFSAFNFPAESLAELVEAESDDYTILSIRQLEDYEKGHIAGAMNIPFGKGMQESFDQIPKDKPVVVYCYTGQTASQTSAVLRMLGYESYNLSGGMGKEDGGGWLGDGHPVVTE